MYRDFNIMHSLQAVSSDGGRVCLYFRNIAALLEAHAAVTSAHPGLKVEATNDESMAVLFDEPRDATSFIDLWLGGHQEESTEGMTRGEELEHLLHRPAGVTLDELVQRWGVKRESAASTLSVQSRKRGLHLEREGDTYRVA